MCGFLSPYSPTEHSAGTLGAFLALGSRCGAWVGGMLFNTTAMSLTSIPRPVGVLLRSLSAATNLESPLGPPVCRGLCRGGGSSLGVT